MIKKVYLSFVVIVGAFMFQNCTLPKAFEALDIYNYFQAKKNFEKVEKRHPVAAKYGLSLIQQKNDNPFYNIDSAYYNITYAVVYYDSLSPKIKQKYESLGIDSSSIGHQQHIIATSLFRRAVKINSEDSFQDFIKKNPTSVWVESAIIKRDSAYFEEVASKNKSSDYQSFMQKYPNSSYYSEAFQRFQRLQYVEYTASDELKDYVSFLRTFPENPYIIEAENQIYRIATKPRTVASFENFIEQYSENRNVRTAWGQLYDAYLTENLTKSAIADFIKAYPNNPFISKIEDDLALSKTVFYPVQENGKWGFKSPTGKYAIDSTYDFVESFSEGLAIVVKDEKVGFIEKTGKLKIDYKYDDALPFSEGCAVVELNGKYGMINRQGEYIIMPEFEFLGNLKDGLIPFEKNQLYGYFDKKGQIKIEAVFSEAYNFEDSLAKVSINDKWGLINTEGQYIFSPKFNSIIGLKKGVFAIQNNELWGAISVNNDTILDFVYDDISQPSNGYYLVSKKDSFNYINESGQLLFANKWLVKYPEYKILGKYDNKPILVSTSKGYNYIDMDGKLIFKYPKHKLGEYSNLIAFKNENLWGYLSNSPPKEVIAPRFDRAFSFEYDYGIVSLSPLWGTIDSRGNFVIEAYYEDLQFLSPKVVLAKGKGDYGLLTEKGDTILPFTSLKIEPFANNTVKVSNQETIRYYNYNTNSWIRKENE